MAHLYIVSTPIGNLGDLSHRAVEVLRGADRILAEDTRRTGILCRAYGIETPLVSAHEHNEAARAEQAVGWLEAGETLALVTDAGTPVLSDPGARLVARVVEAGHVVVPIPGASALLAALVGAGLGAEPFTFYGFLPRSGRMRKERLAELEGLPHTAVVYESPERLVSLLDELAESSGAGRRVVVARELTKVHEEFRRGTLREVADYYRGGVVKGEVVVVVEGSAPGSVEVDAEAAAALAGALLAAGGRASAVARDVARRLGIPRNRAYEIVQRLKGEDRAT
ncbi:MAG TPA: 16S rRNA (cytidine(1402)-2'-O)-methyltransferase [Longimicrobiales bacterium]|nr:16S rRNA (cytidine(1402)-2'-O)-methyltransferase [Longimicrobiales bacterium]